MSMTEETQTFLNLKGKVVIITGASAGIGESTALEFARQGCQLMLSGRNEDRLVSVAEKCLTAGKRQIKVEFVAGDITEEEVQKDIVKRTIDAFGKLDILVNNAGMSMLRNPINTEREVYHVLMKTNVESVVFLTQLAAPHLIQSQGNVVNVSSFATSTAAPAYTVYMMTKAALDSYTKSLSLFLAPNKVRVNSVNPGSVATSIYRRGEEGLDDKQFGEYCAMSAALHPLGGRIGLSSEVADTIVFLASERSSFTTGQIVNIDGGRSLAGATTPVSK